MNVIRLALRQLVRAATCGPGMEGANCPLTSRVYSAIYERSSPAELQSLAAAARRWAASAGRPDRPSRVARAAAGAETAACRIPVRVTNRTSSNRAVEVRPPPVRRAVQIGQMRRYEVTSAPRPTKLMKVGHVNIRSLAPKLDDVRLLIRQNCLDILVVTETWLTKQISDDILIFSGFQVIRADRRLAKRGRERVRGGGIAFIVHEDITMTRLDLAAPPSETRLETLWLNVTAAGGRSAIIGGVYRRSCNIGNQRPAEPATGDMPSR